MDWTLEKIAQLSLAAVKTLRENAARLSDSNLVSLCDAEIARRLPPPNVQNRRSQAGRDSVVVGFHFVCDREKGITRNKDGTVWTGTWVVDKKHAAMGLNTSAYVALHVAKSEPSYLQGVVRDWRVAKRESEYAKGRPVQRENGIDFLLELTDSPYTWRGEGSGEKGYVWD